MAKRCLAFVFLGAVLLVASAAAATIPKGTKITVQSNSMLNCDTVFFGDTFDAELKEDVKVNGLVVAPRGTPVTGHVVRVKGTNQLQRPGSIEVDVITMQLSGKSYPLVTSTVLRIGMDAGNKPAEQKQRRQAGVQAGIDAVHDAITGNTPQGPAAADDGVSRGGSIQAIIPPGTELQFRLRRPVEIPDQTPKKQLTD